MKKILVEGNLEIRFIYGIREVHFSIYGIRYLLEYKIYISSENMILENCTYPNPA